ncbi:hypothetical protein [Dyella silvatica]|uniref:hypothetical protein n=1 Tax=Dyella silvatica TaxID=2992128 RepID=UPI00225BAE09|nr:hypothetical protein [Dyella silvatica]
MNQNDTQAAALLAQAYPISQPPKGPYPEQSIPRYSAAKGMWAACFSGGGPRAFAASLGQMRGLHAAGVVPFLGAISCVSGGSWFGGLFSFASSSYSDRQLLGPAVAPGDLTVAMLDQLPSGYLGSALAHLSNEELAAWLALYLLEYKWGTLPFDKIWGRLLNATLLTPFGLGDLNTSLTLNPQTLAAIQARNPSLNTSFFTLRDDRPFFIAGATLVYPQSTLSPRGDFVRSYPARDHALLQTQPGLELGDLPGQTYRPFEYTPGYSGTPQLFAGAGVNGVDIGNGYVENFAFDTPTPQGANASDIVTVAAGQFPFLLSDAIGSSSAALASLIDLAGYSGGFPYFSYWPIRNIGQQASASYSFGDGGILENIGIVPLLRRKYPVIFAFVNSPFPVNSTDQGCVDGIDGQISRLFGLIPANDYGNDQNTQIFDKAEFARLAAGLKSARAAGGPVVHAGHYAVLPNNPFALESYRPLIFWLYNDLNESWRKQLPPAVSALLNDTNPEDFLANFPNYATVGQNYEELLYLTPRQINLLAHMWCDTMQQGFAAQGQAFGVDLPGAAS